MNKTHSAEIQNEDLQTEMLKSEKSRYILGLILNSDEIFVDKSEKCRKI